MYIYYSFVSSCFFGKVTKKKSIYFAIVYGASILLSLHNKILYIRFICTSFISSYQNHKLFVQMTPLMSNLILSLKKLWKCRGIKPYSMA